MRISSEIFNREWLNDECIYIYTDSGVKYSAFVRSAERILTYLHGLHTSKSFWGGQEFLAVHSIPLKKVIDNFPGDCIYIGDSYIKIVLSSFPKCDNI